MTMLKKFAIDLLGITLIILSVLLGWLPGPGGIPLFLAGLGLLAINHEWARRWIWKVEQHGLNLSAQIFRTHPKWQAGLDIIGILALGFGVWLFTAATHNFLYAVALSTTCLGLALLLGNRKRLKRILQVFKAQAK